MTTTTSPDAPNVFVYGNGTLWTQQGEVEGRKCISIKRVPVAQPVGSQPREWETQYTVSQCDVVLVFNTLAGARVLQDELNELVSTWAKAEAEVVDYTPFKKEAL